MQMNGAAPEGEANEKNNHEMSTDNASASSTNQAISGGPNVEIVRQQRFEVGPRYADLKFIGEGAYGKYLHVLNRHVLNVHRRHGCIRLRS